MLSELHISIKVLTQEARAWVTTDNRASIFPAKKLFILVVEAPSSALVPSKGSKLKAINGVRKAVLEVSLHRAGQFSLPAPEQGVRMGPERPD